VAEHEEGQGEIEEAGQGEPRRSPLSLWPLFFAGGIATLLVGVVTNWVVFGIGCAVAAVAGAAWAIDSVRGAKPRVAGPAAPVEAEEVEEEEEEGPERYGRAKFLEISTVGLGALIGAAVTVPVVGFAIAPSFVGQGDEDINLGALENYPEGQFLVATFESRKGQGEVSLQTAYVRNNGLLNSVPSFTILSNHCVHLGCPVQPGGPTDADAVTEISTSSGSIRLIPTQPASFVCPCHGGAYDTEGNRTAGPPVRALDRYEFSIINGELVLGERYSVGKVEGTEAEATIWRHTRFDPGQHVDGWERALYPVSPRGV
jgi:Rieske Fe-S protein